MSPNPRSRKLLGYVVQLPDGTRSALTKKPVPFRQASCTASADDHARGHVLTPVFAVRRSVVVPTQITTEEQARAFNALEPAAVVEAWNAKHPIGTRVRYWPLRPTSSVLPIETRTRTAAYLMSKGVDHASIMVEGVTGSVNLSTHVDAIDDPKPAPVVAGERYACWAGVCMWLTDGEDDPRDTGTRAEAEARAAGIPGAKVVRILDDGAHEAAIAQAREESRLSGLAEARSIVKAHKRTMTPRTPSDSALGAVLVTLRDAEKAAAEAKYKDRDVEVMRVALADLRRIRACFVARANSLRTIGEVARASGLEDAIKQLDEEVFT